MVSQKEGGLFWDGVLTLPLVLPPVAGFFLLYIFGVKRPVGQFLFKLFQHQIAFSWAATVIALYGHVLPFDHRSTRGGTLVEWTRTWWQQPWNPEG